MLTTTATGHSMCGPSIRKIHLSWLLIIVTSAQHGEDKRILFPFHQGARGGSLPMQRLESSYPSVVSMDGNPPRGV